VRIGSDTGGTFTDLVAADGSIAKVPSTPEDPGRAVRTGMAELARRAGDGSVTALAHGTTVATNALLERRGATTALVTTEGFADVVEIARQDRPRLYDAAARRPEPLVARDARLEVRGRLAGDGVELVPLDVEAVDGLADQLPEGTEAVAVCLLHADLAPAHERQVAEALRARGIDVTCSHEISPEVREYERTVTTVVNAYLRPRCRRYLRDLAPDVAEVVVMTSAGGLVPAADAAEEPARLLLSGPAGGVLAAAAVAQVNGFADAVTFDMGGTSTDVCLVLGGAPAPAAQRDVAGLPVRLPSLDVHTIGAGGGSIARIDPGGALVVGPRSAGAVPGPACYGRGGTEPTVTDADLVLGRIPAGHAFPGLGVLDVDAARSALEGAGVDAEGVVAVVEASMEQALRRVTVERGVDPRGLALVAFGGAGPLHACGLAEALGIATVLVPARAGVLSAVGILAAPRQVDLVRSWPTPDDHTDVDASTLALAEAALAAAVGVELGGVGGATVVVEPPDAAVPARRRVEVLLPGDGTGPDPSEAAAGGRVVRGELVVGVDCRYRGQSHELTVPSVAAFHDEHRARNGFARPDAPVEVVAIRATARLDPAVRLDDLPAPERTGATGPAVLAEADCTIWVPEGWRADPGAAGALVLTRGTP
jgi:N-methylhydantoinase A/oxoprolinase/acetone carboxylase beta subunit